MTLFYMKRFFSFFFLEKKKGIDLLVTIMVAVANVSKLSKRIFECYY